MGRLSTKHYWTVRRCCELGVFFLFAALVTGCSDNNHQTTSSSSSSSVNSSSVNSSSETSEPLTSPQFEVLSGSEGVLINWKAVNGAKSYNVYRCPLVVEDEVELCANLDVSSCGDPEATITDSLSYLDTPPLAPEAFCYRMNACEESNGESCGDSGEALVGVHRLDSTEIAERELSLVISDDGRHTYTNQTTRLHAFVRNRENVDGQITYSWTQIAGDKVSNIQGADTASVVFDAPATSQRIDFKVNATDASGTVAEAKAAIYVRQFEDPVIVSQGHTRVVQPGAEVALHVIPAHSSEHVTHTWHQVHPNPIVHPVEIIGSNTSNPTITVPNIRNSPDGVTGPPTETLVFEHTLTDNNGNATTTQTTLLVQQPVPMEMNASGVTVAAPVLPPNPGPLTVQVPVAATIVSPLLVWSAPVSTNYSGATESLAVLVNGGEGPYTWEWKQKSGTAASFNTAQDIAVPSVTLPEVSSNENLVFAVVVTDHLGNSQESEIVITVQPNPEPSPLQVQEPALINTLPTLTVLSDQQQDIYLSLSDFDIHQLSGPQIKIIKSVKLNSGESRVRIHAPALQVNSAAAELRFVGADSYGQIVWVDQPLTIVRPVNQPAASLSPIPTPTPIVSPSYKALKLEKPLGINVAEGQPSVQLAVGVKGGNLPYTYEWTQQPGSGDPAISLVGSTTRTPTLSLTGVNVNQDTFFNFKVVVTSADGQTAELLVPVHVLNLTPLLKLVKPETQSATEGSASIPLIVGTKGGEPPYSYQWEQVRGATEPAASLSQEATESANADLTSIDVTAPTTLHFRVTVDSADGQSDSIILPLVVLDSATTSTPSTPSLPPVDPLNVATLSSLTVLGGHSTFLHAPNPQGGVSPYSIHITQTGGDPVSVTPVYAGAWKIDNLPDVSLGDKQLTFGFVIRDANKSEVHVSQEVKVVNQLTALVADIAAPTALMDSADKLELLAIAGGGQPGYTYKWTLTPSGLASPSPAFRTSTEQIVDFELWKNPSANDPEYKIKVNLNVTDSSGSSVAVERTIQINNAQVALRFEEAVAIAPVPTQLSRPGSECLLCGDKDMGTACTDLDLALGMTNKCPDTQPYCMNDIRVEYNGTANVDNFWFPPPDDPASRVLVEFRRCVDAKTAYYEWFLQTRNRPECQGNSGSTRITTIDDTLHEEFILRTATAPEQQLPGVSCSIACYGDGCNLDTYPATSDTVKFDRDGNITP